MARSSPPTTSRCSASSPPWAVSSSPRKTPPVTGALALGLLAALGASRLLVHYLYGVSPGDPLTFGVALVLLALLAALASWLLARRASRVDPAVALRST